MKDYKMRKPLKKFAEFQEEILKEHNWKIPWNRCSIDYLCSRLSMEFGELRLEIAHRYNPDPKHHNNKDKIKRECADVANLAMMIYDKVNRKTNERRN